MGYCVPHIDLAYVFMEAMGQWEGRGGGCLPVTRLGIEPLTSQLEDAVVSFRLSIIYTCFFHLKVTGSAEFIPPQLQVKYGLLQVL